MVTKRKYYFIMYIDDISRAIKMSNIITKETSQINEDVELVDRLLNPLQLVLQVVQRWRNYDVIWLIEEAPCHMYANRSCFTDALNELVSRMSNKV